MLNQSRVLRRFTVTQFLLELQFWFPVWLLFLTDRGFDLGIIVVADGVFRTTMVALEVPLGIVADRIGHKRAYLSVSILAVIAYTMISLINSVPMLFASWIMWGVFWAMASGTGSAYAYELTLQEGYGDQTLSVFGTLRAVTNLAALLSQLVAGFLYVFIPAFPFILSAILALTAFLITLTLPEIEHGKSTRKQNKLLEATGLLNQNNSVRMMMILLALAYIFYWSPRILMQPLFIELELVPAIVSMVYFFYSLAGVVAGLTADRLSRMFSRQVSSFGGMLLIWIGILLVAYLPDAWSIVCFPLLGFGFFLTHTILEVNLHQQVDNRNRAAILSTVSLVGGIVVIGSRPALGLIADWVDAPFAFAVWGGVGVLVLLIFAYLQSKVTFA